MEIESIFDETWLDDKSHTIELHKLRNSAEVEKVIMKRQANDINDQVPTAPTRRITQVERKRLNEICPTQLEFSVIYLYMGFNRVSVDKNGDIVGQPTYQDVGQALGIDKNQVKKIVDRVMNRLKRSK